MSENKKLKPKHIGYSGQREFCRNNKHTYIERFVGEPHLMCNYPFPDIHHKKGVCRASTCTDMREIPAEISDADLENELAKEISASDAEGKKVPTCDEVDQNTLADSGEGQEADHVDSTIMPSPSND
jgi:hypothetical protein